jgi:hypothetical protein
MATAPQKTELLPQILEQLQEHLENKTLDARGHGDLMWYWNLGKILHDGIGKRAEYGQSMLIEISKSVRESVPMADPSNLYKALSFRKTLYRKDVKLLQAKGFSWRLASRLVAEIRRSPRSRDKLLEAIDAGELTPENVTERRWLGPCRIAPRRLPLLLRQVLRDISQEAGRVRRGEPASLSGRDLRSIVTSLRQSLKALQRLL